MNTLVTKQAPDFTAPAVMPDNSFGDVRLSSYRGKYVILFFYPYDFSFICPTEIIAFNDRLDEFKGKECEIIGVSGDSVYSHLAWKTMPREQGGIGDVRYPLVSDVTKSVARNYGVLLDGVTALRGWFVIDRGGVVRHLLINDTDLGRNVDEAMRVLDELRFMETNEGVCPANWHAGEEPLQPTRQGISDYLAGRQKKAA